MLECVPMMEQFYRQNRWWTEPAAIVSDRHLQRMAEAALGWEAPLRFRFDRDAIYTLRGARQVGKSTLLKRQVRALLEVGWLPTHIFYVDVELAGLESARELTTALRQYLDAEKPAHTGRCAIFLDEVTRIANWAGAIRGLVDNGELENVTLIATGSHTRDLRAGGERLPGRRGDLSDLDWELRPLGFRDYVALVEPALPLPGALRLPDQAALRASLGRRLPVRPRLAALFRRYLASGGFLVAMNDDARGGKVRAETFQSYRDAIIGEFARAGMRESYLREVVNWMARHLAREFDYRDIASETDIGSKDTARGYVDNLEASYVAMVCYRSVETEQPAPAFRGPKKLFTLDPLFWHLLHAWAASDPDPWPAVMAALQDAGEMGHLAEAVVASHLARVPQAALYYWRRESREVDFLVVSPDASLLAIEVKTQERLDESQARSLAEVGGGLLLTSAQEGELAGGAVYAAPTSEFLVMLDAPALAPCHS